MATATRAAVRSPIYWSPSIYRAVMRRLYQGDADSRLDAVAEAVIEAVPDNAVVLDLCCGPGDLCRRLSSRTARYYGVDINLGFLREVRRAGGIALAADVRFMPQLPPCDVITMVGSLYHFLPDASSVVDRMLHHARVGVVLCEPVQNITTSRRSLVHRGATLLTNPGTEAPSQRFNAASFKALIGDTDAATVTLRPVAGGREVLVLLVR